MIFGKLIVRNDREEAYFVGKPFQSIAVAFGIIDYYNFTVSF